MKKFFILLLKPFSFLPALLVMYLIFSFSSQTGTESGNLSYKISHKIIVTADTVLDKNMSEEQIAYYTDKIHTPVRKLAHMSEYFVLAVCVSFPLYVYGLRGILLILFAGFISVGFACTDEFHQSFVAGRGPSKRDVMIDSIGAFAGILLVQFVCWNTLRRSLLTRVPYATRTRLPGTIFLEIYASGIPSFSASSRR